MTFLQILMIALGLSADSFAVSATEGVLLKHSRHIHSLRVAIIFGICQGTLPVLGWLAGANLYEYIDDFADGVAFIIICIIGIKMILGGLKYKDYEKESGHSTGYKLWFLGVAVSIDSMGVGVSLGVVGVRMWMPALMIGSVTAVTCVIGVQLGDRIGSRIGEKAEIIGGVILLILGFSFLL